MDYNVEYSADSLILNPYARYYMNDFFVHGGLNFLLGSSESNTMIHNNTQFMKRLNLKLLLLE